MQSLFVKVDDDGEEKKDEDGSVFKSIGEKFSGAEEPLESLKGKVKNLQIQIADNNGQRIVNNENLDQNGQNKRGKAEKRKEF